MISSDKVKHVASLARIELSDSEVDKFTVQLGEILDYVEILSEVDTENIEATSQVTGLINVSRDDVVEPFCTREEMLGCTELPVIRHMIKVKPVITN